MLEVKYLLLFPLNIILMILICFILSFLNLSTFYEANNFEDLLYIIFIVITYYIAYLFFKKKNILNNVIDFYEENKKYMENKFIFPLLIGIFGFLLEFFFKGVPLFISGGRDDYIGIPVIHPMSYSFIIVAVVYACSYARLLNIFFTFIIVATISTLLLSRQMFMISIVIFLITYFVRNEVSISKFLKSFSMLYIVFILFGYIGNIRQKLSGDYVEHYIYTIGGINKFGENFSDTFIWLWLYLVTPIYNLFANIKSFEIYGNNCNYNLTYGDCNGDFLTSVFVPNTILKYLNSDSFIIDLVVGHLNVGTGYAVSGRLLGIWGIIFQIIVQVFIFYFGYKFYKGSSKFIFIVLFSAFSIFMIFDNLFTKGEFFFCFIVIYLMQYKVKWK